MKKLLIFLVAVLALFGVVTPKLIGLLLGNNSVAGSLRDLTGQPGLSLQLESGWFSSHGQLTVVDPVISGTPYPGVEMTSPVTVMHGPLLFTDEGLRFGLAAAELQPTITGMVAEDPLQQLFLEGLQNPMTVTAGLDASMHIYTNTKAMEYRQDGEQLNMSNLQVDLSIAADRRSDLLLAIDEGTMRSALYQASAHGNRLRLQSADLSQAPLPGSLEINIDEIRVNTAQPPQQLTVRGIRLDYVALPDNNNDTVSFTQDVAISELDTPWPVRSLALHSELSGVDSALTSFYLDLTRVRQGDYSDPRTQQQSLQQMYLLFRDTLRRPLQQHATLTTQAYDGEQQAQLSITWPGLPDLQGLDQLTVGDILRNLQMTLDLTAEEEALMSSPLRESISAYQSQGVLPGSNNGIVTLHASLKDAILTINELRLPLESFIDTDARPFPDAYISNAQGLPTQP